MNEVPLRAFLLRLPKELDNKKFKWVSTVQHDRTNVIYADMHLSEGDMICTNDGAISVYGKVRTLRAIGGTEWIDKLSYKRSVFGPIFLLETLL